MVERVTLGRAVVPEVATRLETLGIELVSVAEL
jgi:hypothetical protein